MKRYDLRQGEFLDQRIDIVEMSNGKYVKYKDIKDDRALLEEAVDLIEDLDATINSVAGRKNDFLARAKERLG